MTALILLLLLPGLAWGGAFLSAEVDRDTITLGDPVLLTLRIDAPADEDASLPAFEEGTIGPFEILEAFPFEVDTVDGVRHQVARYRITAFETGAFEIPAIGPEGGESEVSSKPIEIVVRSVGLDPSGETRTVKDPVRVSRNWVSTLLPLAVLLLLAAAALLLYLRRRRKKRIPAPELRAVDLRPAHVIAWEALDELERSGASGNGARREFYFLLSGVVREYIRNRYALPAPERTSREILREIREERLPTEATGILRDLLAGCDLVKFRGVLPPQADAEEMMRRARRFVETTRERGGEEEKG